MYRNDIDYNFSDIIPGKEYELFKLDAKAQCARTDLNKRFLSKPMTTTG